MQKLSKWLIFTGITSLISVQFSANAETRYVSDELEITLRTGPAVNNKITRMLKSGAPLEVLKSNGAGYTQVRANSGETGWVLSRFLMNSPSARSRLNAVAEKETLFARQANEIQALRREVTTQSKKFDQLNIENKTLEGELKQVKIVASDTLSINNQNKDLNVALSQARAMQSDLQIENNRLRSNTEQAWFIRGAGVILLGMVLGLLIPKLRFKKKKTWGSLDSYN